MSAYLRITMKSGREHLVEMDPKEGTTEESICKEFYHEVDFSAMNTFRFGSRVIYAREIESFEFVIE